MPAKEVVQDTMLWLWENKNTLIPELSLKSLLCTIVKNKCLNSCNRCQRKNRILETIKEKHRERFEDPDFYLENELFSLFDHVHEKHPMTNPFWI
ncbi:MAG: hypothetical protein PHD28_03065 [Proteiniphilum sp.]|nr:hypothetical protein [Proteiniphilum sp.]